MKTVYNIIEVANVHAGDFEYLKELVKEFAQVKGAEAIKFQPFKYDKIAIEDFPWYDVYKKLFLNETQWKEIIKTASAHLDVWIDTFDEYSLSIIAQNLDKVEGLKFQSSILFNKKLLSQCNDIDLSEKRIMLNISGIEESQIQTIINDFTKNLKPKEIILQVGFQGYPTEAVDNGLNKIRYLQKKFGNRIAFADHVDSETFDSKMLPVLAVLQGAEFIEKHVKLQGKPEYDHYSSLDLAGYNEYLSMLDHYTQLLHQPFINEKERHYLTSTIQIPTLNKSAGIGVTLSLGSDFEYKRTAQHGLRTNELQKLLENFYILASNKKAGEAIRSEDLKKANIAVVIACRLKSSRLPKKALLKIGDLSSVEFCIKSALKFKNINHTILATSDVEEDAELENYLFSPQVVFHRGHPLDVIQRYLDIADKLRIDVIVRVTADMPYISDDILQPILESHFREGADYTKAKAAAIGTNLEVINVEALRRVKKYFPKADYSEYMTYYFTNNPEEFKLNEIDLPASLIRNYRLTLDYPEDLALFNMIQAHLNESKLDTTLSNVFAFLDSHPDAAAMNSNMEVKYLTDTTLIDILKANTTISKK